MVSCVTPILARTCNAHAASGHAPCQACARHARSLRMIITGRRTLVYIECAVFPSCYSHYSQDALQDMETRYRQRYLDLMLNPSTSHVHMPHVACAWHSPRTSHDLNPVTCLTRGRFCACPTLRRAQAPGWANCISFPFPPTVGTRGIFLTRTRIINFIRRFLDMRGFLEVSVWATFHS